MKKIKAQIPYNSRNHENTIPVDQSDVLAVAGLLGQVSGELKGIDHQNVGSDSQHVKAAKMDPKAALKDFVVSGPTSKQPHPAGYPVPGEPAHVAPVLNVEPPPVPLAVPPPVQPPPVIENRVEVVAAMEVASELADRVEELESIIKSYKKIVKFKRGISYTITTSKIKGEFKDPGTLLDLISTEIAKQTKVITFTIK